MSNVYFFTTGAPRFELSLSQNCIGKSKSMAVSAFEMLYDSCGFYGAGISASRRAWEWVSLYDESYS